MLDVGLHALMLDVFPVYEAGKAVKHGLPSQYAPTLYAPSMYAQPAYGGQPGMPMLPMPNMQPQQQPNGYGREYDGASSGESRGTADGVSELNLVCPRPFHHSKGGLVGHFQRVCLCFVCL